MGRAFRIRALAPMPLLLVLAATAASAGPAGADPAFDYLLHCGGCHREHGAGAPPAVPDLRGSLGAFASFPAGRAYVVRVPGAAQAPIDDVALAAVLNWMLASFGAHAAFEPFTPQEVGAYRSAPLLDPLRTRRLVLARAPGADPTR